MGGGGSQTGGSGLVSQTRIMDPREDRRIPEGLKLLCSKEEMWSSTRPGAQREQQEQPPGSWRDQPKPQTLDQDTPDLRPGRNTYRLIDVMKVFRPLFTGSSFLFLHFKAEL